jgi:uncharacterized tellurite resistance protein B-like protein
MSILQRLGLKPKPELPSADTETVRRIAENLEALPPERAKFVGSFALVLARVANADFKMTEDETRLMEQLVAERAGLPEAQAALAVEIAKAQHRLFGSTEDYLASRELRAMTSREERVEILSCLFAISAADDSVSTAEEEVIRQIAKELGLEHRDYIAARVEVRDKRDILRGMP